MRVSNAGRCALGLIVLLLSTPVVAQDFRVETSIFAAGSSQPFARNLTLFSQGLVYDFPLNADKAVVFDPAHQRFLLLDGKRRLCSELNLEELNIYVSELKRQGLETKQAFLFDPRFTATYASASRRLTLKSDAITYRVKGAVPPESHADAVSLFRQFTDWSARLNAAHKGSFPPFGRLALNGQLQDRGLLPEHVEFEYTPPGKPGDKALYESRQAFAWLLTDDDRRRIDETSRQLREFKSIGFRQYHEESR